MRGRRISTYILFGTGFRFLQDAREGFALGGSGGVVNAIERVLEGLDEFELVVTKRAAYELRDAHAMLKTGGAAKLTRKDAEVLNALVKRLRPTLMAEAQGAYAYIVSDKRVDVDRLISDVGALFAPHAFPRLTEISRLDFEEAGKCIAFERPTAAAFHLLRGTEGCVRVLYEGVTQKSAAGLNWGAAILELRTVALVPVALLDALDSIRRHYRNPTQHPDLVYTLDGAQDLLFLTVDVVNRMTSITPSTILQPVVVAAGRVDSER